MGLHDLLQGYYYLYFTKVIEGLHVLGAAASGQHWLYVLRKFLV
jgi:hypothetical protein